MKPSIGLRVLLVLPQLPQDPASGAARSMTSICELLADAGFVIRALGTTASESGSHLDAAAHLRLLGIGVQISRGQTRRNVRPELLFEHRGIEFRLLDVGRKPIGEWESILGRQFDLAFDEEIHTFHPDILFTYGGSPGDVRRYDRARRIGIKVVFGLRNEAYLTPEFFDRFDGVLTPSRYLTDRYWSAIGLKSTPLPAPMRMEDALADEHEPIFVTMVNPTREKGLMFFARLAEELSVRRPDIPILVIESRGSAGLLASAGLAGGFDLRRHQNIMVSAAVPKPRDIFQPARLILVPSLVEAGGRVVAEALLNGVPPLVSDRGGLAEVANGAGFVLPVPASLDRSATVPVAADVVELWLESIFRLEDDAEFYAAESEKARMAGQIYRWEELRPRYSDYFRDVADG